MKPAISKRTPGDGRPLAALALALAVIPAQALDRSTGRALSLSTSTSLGILYGTTRDFVYNQSLSKDYKNSELVWPFAPLLYSGAGLSLDTSFGLRSDLGVKAGFSGKTGTMTDSDFLNGDGKRTHYSQSDCYTERALVLDLGLGYEFAPLRAMKLGLYAGFSYMNFKWSARDGYYQYPTSGSQYSQGGLGLRLGDYPPWSADATKTPIYGTGILYEQEYFAGSLGLKFSYDLFDALRAEASFALSPLVACDSVDNHEDRSVDFTSMLAGGIMIEPSLRLGYALKEGAWLILSASYRAVSGLKGDLYQSNQGVTWTSSGDSYYAGPDSAGKSPGGSGAALSSFDASLGLTLPL
jgi:outer membrane protease